MLRRALLLLACILAVTALGYAQETTGAITGRIVDAQGLALAGATVTATGPQGSRSATTDGEGRFRLPFLTPGTYAVRAELPGFKGVEQKSVPVRLGQTVDLPGLVLAGWWSCRNG